MWPSFWYHFCATLPLEMRTVGLVLFLQAFALLSVLYCLPAVKPSDQAFSPTVQPMFSSVSVDRMPPLPPPTPTPPLPPVTGDTLGKIFWILVLPPLPLLVLSLPCWSRVSDTWALPAINHGNRGDRGGVAGMSRGRSVWGSMAVIDLPVHHPSTPFLPSLTSNTTVLTQTPPQLQSSTLSRFLLPTPITRNKVIWFVSTPVKTTQDSLLLSSTPSQLGPKRNVQKLWNSWKMNVLTYCFWQRHGWKLTATRVSVLTWHRRATSCGLFHVPRVVVDWPWSTETTFLSPSAPPSPSPTPPLNSCNFSSLPPIIFTSSAFTDPRLVGKTSSLTLSFFPSFRIFWSITTLCEENWSYLVTLTYTLTLPPIHWLQKPYKSSLHSTLLGCSKSNPPLWAHHRLGAVQGKWAACSFLPGGPCTLLWPSAGGVSS